MSLARLSLVPVAVAVTSELIKRLSGGVQARMSLTRDPRLADVGGKQRSEEKESYFQDAGGSYVKQALTSDE